MSNTQKILLFTDYFVPGFKSGGPVQTIANLVENLGDEFEFYIVTRDRDSGDNEAYSTVEIDDWNRVGIGRVYYASPGADWPFRLTQLWNEIQPDCVYLNSFFSPKFTIMPLVLRKLGMVPQARTIVAPRGEFHDGALNIKAPKKSIYRKLAKMVGLYDGVEWCATTKEEEAHIRGLVGADAPVRRAPNLGCLLEASRDAEARPKESGKARFVVVARISPIKNHHLSLQWLSELDGDVLFDIYGPIGDEDYWQRCKEIIADMPNNVEVNHRGPIPHDEVHDKLGEYDFFLMPSSSENHGHSIVEAMMAGCPPIISTGTPWRGLRDGKVGLDLPIDDHEGFVDELQRCVEMGSVEYAAWSNATHQYGRTAVCSEEALELNRRLFRQEVEFDDQQDRPVS